MSQAAADIEKGDDTDGHPEQPQLVLNQPTQPSHGGSNFGDSSGPLFSMYSKTMMEEDVTGAERCQKDADTALIFAGLFSATVGALLTVSLQDLRQNPQDISAFYLEKIYRILAESNASSASIPSTVAELPPFSPPGYAVWVNSLWSLSLAVSVSSALLGTSLQQWARRYIKVTQRRGTSPEKRARMRAIFSNGLKNIFLTWEGEELTAFLHFSLLLFVVGAIIYSYNLHHDVFKVVVGWAALYTSTYVVSTLAPIFKSDLLLYTPLSPIIFRCYLVTSYVVSQLWSYVALCHRFSLAALAMGYSKNVLSFVECKWRAIQEVASNGPSEIDAQVLEETFDSLGGDDEFEMFFQAIPGFFHSKLVDDVEEHLSDEFRIKFGQALHGFLDRTFSSNSVSELARSGRFIICLNAARVALGLDGVSQVFSHLLHGRWPEALRSVEVGHSLRRWWDQRFSSELRKAITRIISHARNRDHRWLALVRDALGVPDSALRDYITYGDSASFAILIHLLRQLFHSGFQPRDSDVVLEELSHFDISNTLPSLQHSFCALWNEMVEEARRHGAGSTPDLILKAIRHIYVALHQDTGATHSGLTTDDDDPLLYPLCDVVGHRPNSARCADNAPAGNTAYVPSFPMPMPYTHLVALQPSGDVPSQSIFSAPSDAAASTATRGNVDIAIVPIAAGPNSSGGPGLLRDEGTDTIIPPAIVFDPPSMPIPMLAPSSDAIPAMFRSSIDPTVPPPAVAVLDRHTTLGTGTTGVHDDVRDWNPPIPMEGFGHGSGSQRRAA